jgi:hypothetical protein
MDVENEVGERHNVDAMQCSAYTQTVPFSLYASYHGSCCKLTWI